MSESYDHIEAVPMEWLIQGFIPYGTVTLLAGAGGVGKGMVATYIAAKVTLARGPVVLVSPEDDLESTVAYRLRAAGADLTKVHDLTFDDDGNPFSLPGMVGELRRTVDRLDAHLVVIDPLMACTETSIASNLGARKVIAPLQRMAAETDTAVLLTHHLVKSGAVAGSKGLTDACRLVYSIAADRENPAVKVIRSVKANVANSDGCRRYVIQGDGENAVVHWITGSEQRHRRLFRRGH